MIGARRSPPRGDSYVLRLGRSGALLLAMALAASAPAVGQEPVVARVEIQGNRLLPADTLLYYVSTRAGHRYDEVRLREDFRRLWATGFLEDLALDVEDDAAGKVVRFRVQERSRIRIVDYRGSKALTPTKIADRLKEEGLSLPLDGFYEPEKARKAEEALRRMLEAEGFPFAKVGHDAKPLAGGVQVSFVVDDGLRALVRTIGFAGNAAVSDAALRGRMKRIKERSFRNFSWLTGKNVFTRERWEEDQRRLREHLLDEGHVEAAVGEPTLTYEDGTSGFFKKKKVKWLRLDVPVTEGPTYRVGEIRFEGLTLFEEADVRPLFDLETGDLYRDARIRKGLERLRDAYGREGYVQATGLPDRRPDPDRNVVDVTVKVDEDERYTVGRIVFRGNDTTKDKVIRREVFLKEGDVLNAELLKASIRRLNQLGYFKAVEAPEFAPSPVRSDALDLTFPVEEQSRHQFTFGAAVAPVEGTTFNLGFSTANFLGGGQRLVLAAERGARTENYQLGLTEPYLFDKPVSAGFDVYKKRVSVPASTTLGRPGYDSDQFVTRVSAGRYVGRFTRFLADYSFGVVTIAPLEGEDPATVGAGTRHESRLTPSLVLDTVDHPLMPRRGLRIAGSLGVTGGPLGGTVSYLEPALKTAAFAPLTRRTALGFRAEAGWLVAFGATADTSPITGRNGIPYDQRYFLGGDTQIRGFDFLEVGPTDDSGTRIGGSKFVLASAEHYLDVGGPFRFVLFLDAGQAFREGDPIDLGKLRTSTGVELRFLMPVVNVPIRLIQSWNLGREPGQKRSDFKVSFGVSF